VPRPVITVDFETKPIVPRPGYPPEPVGVDVKFPGEPSEYYAWAHPEGNSCTWEEGCHLINWIWDHDDYDVLFHHGKFDQDVAETYMGVNPLPWWRAHDTEFLLFLYDPDMKNLKLKDSAERLLGWPPEERDELMEWILRNVPGTTPKGQGLKNPGAWICLTPVPMCARYANGDCDRTWALFEWLMPKIREMGMEDAYNRERHLMPYLLQSERDGLLVNLDLLQQDVETYQECMSIVEGWIRERINAPGLNIDSDRNLILAMKAAGSVKQFPRTKPTKRYPGGQESTSKKFLTLDMYNDPPLFHALGYRNRLATCLGTFMEKWLERASPENRIFTNWHQTTTQHGGTGKGARTGRVTSSDPPFTNMAKSWDDRNDGYVHPDWLGVPPLPLVRQYILPDVGMKWVHRDYNQQEMRIMAHYENGQLMRAYRERPWRVMNDKGRVKVRMDAHQYVTDMINNYTRLELSRKVGKAMDLGMTYGEGKDKITRQLGVPYEQAELIFMGHKAALPDLATLQKTIRDLSRQGQPVITWGGRLYYTQSPIIVIENGHPRKVDFTYKQLNRLIQPSAADQSKESIIRYFEHPKRQGKFLVSVYDENNVCAEDPDAEDAVLKECMESIESDVPMLTDGKRGDDWGHLEDVNDEEG
jgi:DNA polymerase-1